MVTKRNESKIKARRTKLNKCSKEELIEIILKKDKEVHKLSSIKSCLSDKLNNQIKVSNSEVKKLIFDKGELKNTLRHTETKLYMIAKRGNYTKFGLILSIILNLLLIAYLLV